MSDSVAYDLLILPCCGAINNPSVVYHIEEDVLQLKYSEFPDDFIEIKGQFFTEIEDFEILEELMISCFHNEVCVWGKQIEREIIKLILLKVINKIVIWFIEDVKFVATDELEIALQFK